MKFRNYLNESSSFIKSLKYLKGLKPCGKGMAILTSDLDKLSPEENNKNFESLKEMLKGKNYYQSKGHYGNIENSIIIIDISLKEASKLANDPRWKQDSFIWIQPLQNGLNYQMIRGNKKVSSQKVESGDDVQKINDFFTMIKGRKFRIPFVVPDMFWK